MDPQYGLREGDCTSQFAWNRSTLAHYICVCVLNSIQFFVTPQTADLQASLSLGFPRQEYWSGLPFPSLEDLPDPGIEPKSPALRADSLLSESPMKPSWQTWLWSSKGSILGIRQSFQGQQDCKTWYPGSLVVAKDSKRVTEKGWGFYIRGSE